jgi:deoxycytidylate deaminase
MESKARPSPEIVIGLVTALGARVDVVTAAIANSMRSADYVTHEIRISDLIEDFFDADSAAPDSATRLEKAMEYGTRLRVESGCGWAAAGLAIRQIRKLRQARGSRGNCYVLRSLKHPDEIHRLRAVYGDRFLAVSIYSPRNERIGRVAQRFATADGGRSTEHRDAAERLVRKDDREQGTELGQLVREAFPLADVFVSSMSNAEAQTSRWLDLLFERPVITPTRDEAGMFQAFAASLQSAAMGRQVGAAITTKSGDLISVGCNEVPCAGGGHYWDGDDPDGRDFRLGFDQSDFGKRNALREVIKAFREAGWLNRAIAARHDDQALLDKVIMNAVDAPQLKESAVLSLTEFTRDVHAETAALLSAAKRGIAVRDAVLYATAFPCHNCAKHIVAAGISRVVYIEPYAKSYASEFYKDSVAVDDDPADGRVPFQPFTGVAPRHFVSAFQIANKRKDRQGRTRTWRRSEALPHFVRRGLDVAIPKREESTIVDLQRGLKNVEVSGRRRVRHKR